MMVWIPKAEGGKGPESLRPLQLPGCKNRLLSAFLAAMIWPPLEARMSRWQAAKQGGTAAGTSRRCMTTSPRPDQPAGGDLVRGRTHRGCWMQRLGLWTAAFGPAAEAMDHVCQRANALGPVGQPAVIFAD